MIATFLSRFFVYAVSAILVSVLALFVLSLNEKRLKSEHYDVRSVGICQNNES